MRLLSRRVFLRASSTMLLVPVALSGLSSLVILWWLALRLLVGGEVPKMSLTKGYYVTPTVVYGLPPDHRLMKEELFVPLVAVDEVSSLDEALEKANKTEFGLTAGVFTKDPREQDQFFEKIRFGVVYANRKGGATTGAWPGAQPFGGWKGSGATGKGAGGPYYLLQFMHEQAQTVVKDS